MLAWPFETVPPFGLIPSPEPLEKLTSYLDYELTSHRDDKPLRSPRPTRVSQKDSKATPKYSRRMDNQNFSAIGERGTKVDKGPIPRNSAYRLEENTPRLPMITRPRRGLPKKKPVSVYADLVHASVDLNTRVGPIVYRFKSGKTGLDGALDSSEKVKSNNQDKNGGKGSHRNTIKKGKGSKFAALQSTTNGDGEKSSSSKELQLPFSSIPDTSDGYLKSYRQFQTGKNKYDVFWAPAVPPRANKYRLPLLMSGSAKSIEGTCSLSDELSQTVSEDRSWTDPTDDDDWIDTDSDPGVVIINAFPDRTRGPRKPTVSSTPPLPGLTVTQVPMVNRSLGSRLGGRSPVKQRSTLTLKNINQTGEKSDLSLNVAENDDRITESEFNDEELGELKILSSGSERGTPELIAPRKQESTGPLPDAETSDVPRFTPPQAENDMRQEAAGFVADMLANAHDFYTGHLVQN